MPQQQYIISRKVNILELGQVLGNISEACRKLGVSRVTIRHYEPSFTSMISCATRP